MSPLNFNKEDGILETKSTSPVSLEDMLAGITFLATNPDLPRKLKILEDARGSKVVFSVDQLEVIGSKLLELIPLYDNIRHAVIHDSPINTVYAMLIARKFSHKKHQLEIFATREAAIKWLNDFD